MLKNSLLPGDIFTELNQWSIANPINPQTGSPWLLSSLLRHLFIESTHVKSSDDTLLNRVLSSPNIIKGDNNPPRGVKKTQKAVI